MDLDEQIQESLAQRWGGKEIEITLDDGGEIFANVYEPAVYNEISKFSVAIPAERLDEDLRKHFRIGRSGLINAGSSRRVQVTPDDEGRGPNDPVDILLYELQRLDAQNIRRDAVFKGRKVAVRVKVLVKGTHYADRPRADLPPVTLGLEGVTVYL